MKHEAIYIDYYIMCVTLSITKHFTFIEHLHGPGTVLSISLVYLILITTLKGGHNYPHLTDQ